MRFEKRYTTCLFNFGFVYGKGIDDHASSAQSITLQLAQQPWLSENIFFERFPVVHSLCNVFRIMVDGIPEKFLRSRLQSVLFGSFKLFPPPAASLTAPLSLLEGGI